MPRPSRASRQSLDSSPIPTLEHDAIAVALQAALGNRVLLIRPLGEGGMGRVYLGRDPRLKRFVAVKVLLQSLGADEEAHARFQREAQAIAAVSHANVVAIYGVGELPDGTPYFIMQHVAGGSMADRLAASGPLPIDVAEGVLGDVAAALAAAHRRGIVHRDVKPANVLWDDESERATVSDFGIAALQESEGDESDMRITASGMAVGSPAYMSPEQLLTETITPKSDIYALGLLGYELLTGRGPYETTTPSDLVAAHLRDTPRRLSELRADVPLNLESLLLRCLAKSAGDRPSADEVMLALTPGAADALEWPPPGLERTRGALWRLMPMSAMGTAYLLLPLLLLVKSGSDQSTVSGNAWPFILVTLSLLGITSFARAGTHAWRIRGALARAVMLGYGWGTMGEVLADRRSDTGSVIAGTREYASLSPGERSVLRVLRVLAATLLFLAAPLALFTAIIDLGLHGSQAGGDAVLVGSVVSTALFCAVFGILCGLYEPVRLASIRRRRAERPRHASVLELAPAWYAAFERSREGQPFGAGRPMRHVATMLLVSAGTIAVLLSAALLLTVIMITVSGQLMDINRLSFGSGALADQSQRQSGGASYRLPPDGHTSPREAGDALLAVASTGRRRPPSPLEHASSADYPLWRRVTPPTSLFPASIETPWTTAAILAAANGLTPAQRTLLEQAAAHPARDEFSRAAQAASADVYGALLELPPAKPIDPFTYPPANLFAVGEAAESYAAQVALDIADHRPGDAERRAREIIAVGALMLDLHQLIDNIAGINVLRRGVSTLGAVYVATGRERDARMLLDSVASAATRRQKYPIGASDGALVTALHDNKRLRGARMEALYPLLFRVCADPKQLLFGVNADYRATVAYARDSVARYPSERVWVEGVGAWLAGDITGQDSSGDSGAFVVMGRVLDSIVGGHRFANCAALSPIRSAM